VERPPLLRCKTPDLSMSCLCPLMGSQHPSDGLFTPWRSELIISPCVPVQMVLVRRAWSCTSKYALHGLISDRNHSNVNHISSSILLNMCIKSLIHQLTTQRRYTSLQYKSGEKDKASYWAIVHRRRKVLGRSLIQAM
jgi:hypothetical protein